MPTVKHKPQRQYPPVYEKIVPMALKGLLVIIILLLGITIAVVLGIFPRLG
ncbi:MAG: hypothetical protein JXA13_15000 [Anaerolineales bacterium]|nr:hypothetical protein [Anaerolineales bacterium]